jgi:hypothetical protein
MREFTSQTEEVDRIAVAAVARPIEQTLPASL